MAKQQQTATQSEMSELRKSPMLAHLLDALEEGSDIGHYGQLVFVMVARYFIDNEEIVQLLMQQPEMDEKQARVLVMQVEERDYSPPQRNKIMEWQAEQEFPICPTPDDPNSCNVYSDLQFPQHVYDRVEEYYEERAEAQMQTAE